MKISIVSPVYNAGGIVDELCSQINLSISNCSAVSSYEIILVDDRSEDDSWSRIKNQSRLNGLIKGVRLSKNFGQHAAITAGLKESVGDFVIVMDCDLQQDPSYFADLIIEGNKGYDIVLTRTLNRDHSRLRNIQAHVFNIVFNFLIGNKNRFSDNRIGSFSLLSRKVVDCYLGIKDYHRHYLMILRWLGFQIAYVDIIHKQRFDGESSYNFKKLLNHALNGITAQSNQLLYLSIYIGFFIGIISFFLGLYVVLSYLKVGYLNGWTSLIVAILFSTGLILMSLGIIGVYLARVFDQVRDRPLYLVDERTL